MAHGNPDQTLTDLQMEYQRRFDRPPAFPFDCGEAKLIALLRRALETGDPEIDPLADLPTGVVV